MCMCIFAIILSQKQSYGVCGYSKTKLFYYVCSAFNEVVLCAPRINFKKLAIEKHFLLSLSCFIVLMFHD